MNKYHFRILVSRFLYNNIGSCKSFRTQGALADFLSVRQATVSSWINRDSCIDAFTFFRICQAFSLQGKKDVKQVFSEFLDVYRDFVQENYKS